MGDALSAATGKDQEQVTRNTQITIISIILNYLIAVLDLYQWIIRI